MWGEVEVFSALAAAEVAVVREEEVGAQDSDLCCQNTKEVVQH